jgi:hypothetical protein
MQASKEIEQEFGLTKARKKQSLNYELKPVKFAGSLWKSETRRAITTVLDYVLPLIQVCFAC